MRKILCLIVFSVIPAVLAEKSAYADFYRYIDPSGVTHITNVPASSKYVWIMREKNPATPDRFNRGRTTRVRKGQRAFDDLIRASSARHGVDPALVRAIVKAESDFDASAVSIAGARGLMQLMPETARITGVRDMHDPEENIDGGIRHLSGLLKKFGFNVPLAVAAYNAGENAVIKYGAVPPFEETRGYVKKVLYYYETYRQSGQ
ncbi:MAG: lytic transglycosylase domain-containing protein [Deltaproteobacteria bacterium]|nr:lytic transglycosylase domain-containing protein [Deltaproteobacteria bacterium]